VDRADEKVIDHREKPIRYRPVKNKLVFYRQFPMQVRLNKRTCFFYFSAGFSGELDAQSGMSVSLPSVDLWIAELLKKLEKKEFKNEAQILADVEKFLGKKGNLHQASLFDPVTQTRFSLRID
jgi:hypothetical protein